MKFVSYIKAGKPGFGAVLDKNKVVDLTDKIAGVGHLAELVSNEKSVAEAKSYVAKQSPEFDLDDVTLEPVIPAPSKIICVGINYVAHAAEAGRKVGEHPVIFHRFADTLQAANAPLIRPIASQDFDFEAELAVVIGKVVPILRPNKPCRTWPATPALTTPVCVTGNFTPISTAWARTFAKPAVWGPGWSRPMRSTITAKWKSKVC